MARKPITLELAGGKSQRQRIWEAVLTTTGKTFELADVTPGGVPDDISRDYLRGLTLAGYLELIQQGKAPRVRAMWKLLRESGAEAPRVNRRGIEATQGRGNEAIWGAMQALGSFTPRVLAEMAGIKESTVKSYCFALSHAGYLTVERQGKGNGCGGIQAQYRLLKSRVQGPRPPMITRLKAVYDPNIHQIVWQQNADDVLEEMDGGAL